MLIQVDYLNLVRISKPGGLQRRASFLFPLVTLDKRVHNSDYFNPKNHAIRIIPKKREAF